MPELTGPQIITHVPYKKGAAQLSNTKIRKMRKDPVIALVRLMFFSGVYAGKWSYEAEDEYEERKDFIKEQMDPMRRHILSTGALGCFDFGWQPYEKIFDIKSDKNILKKLKQLIQDKTEVEEDIDTGAFLGLTNDNVFLHRSKSLVLNFDVEGTDWRGTSTVGNAEKPYDQGTYLDEAASRYDQKVAGAHWLIRYPEGSTPFKGKLTPNHEIADIVLKHLQSSGSIAFPIKQQDVPGLEKLGWEIKLESATGSSVDFTQRFEYLDKSKSRALGFPERSLLEGTHGTKAEAGAHQDFVITMIEYRHACILELVNWHLVNQLLRLNWGPEAENTVKISASPLNDTHLSTLQELYQSIISQPDGFIRESERIDIRAVTEGLGIPTKEEEVLV